MIHNTQSAQISQKQDEHNIYVIMKTMCLFTGVCLEHSQKFGWRICENCYGYSCWLYSQRLCLECLTGFRICLKFISFVLFINYSGINLCLYSFTFLFINLCACFMSVYTGRFLLLFRCASMFHHFCLRNLYMKTFVRTFF